MQINHTIYFGPMFSQQQYKVMQCYIANKRKRRNKTNMAAGYGKNI